MHTFADSRSEPEKPTIFCLVPVKDEAWILERFLRCASIWADRIIIADQGSTDGSREIMRSFPKVTLIDNPSLELNEPERQQMLIGEARRTDGPRVFLALDADEFLTSNFLTSPEWKTIMHAAPGTVISFQWPGVQANGSDLCYSPFPYEIQVGFVDDGSEHKGRTIHSKRVPSPPGAPVLALSHIKLMHYCQHDCGRFQSRIRWYQCYEYVSLNKRPIDLYRFYQQDLFGPSNVVKPVPKEWIQGYEERGIDMTSVNRQGRYRWDAEVLRYFEKYGTTKLKRLPLWDVDWNDIYYGLYSKEPGASLDDPRSGLDKLVHKWLKMTQPDWCHFARPSFSRRLVHKCVHRLLRMAGW